MTDQVLVERGKDDTRLWDASAPEVFAKACLAILKECRDEGWYYEPDVEWVERQILSPEQMASLPEAVQKREESNQSRLQQELDQTGIEMEWYRSMIRTVETNDLSLTKRNVPNAYYVLVGRNDYEYERVSLESVKVAT